MIREQWKKIGIQPDVKELERSLAYQRRDANEHQIHAEITWGTENMFGHHMGALFPVDGSGPIGPLYGKWFASGGNQGKEPPPRMRELMGFILGPRRAGAERVQLAQDVWKIAWTKSGPLAPSGSPQGFRACRFGQNHHGQPAGAPMGERRER